MKDNFSVFNEGMKNESFRFDVYPPHQIKCYSCKEESSIIIGVNEQLYYVCNKHKAIIFEVYSKHNPKIIFEVK